ncbi:MAG: hypothetical protein ACJ8CR_03545 [Roseiflexaceae bacterium]
MIYDASRDLMFWLLQYRNDGGDNRQRLMETPEQPLTPDLVHVVYTRDALGIARLYVDGAEQAQRTTSGDLSVSKFCRARIG